MEPHEYDRMFELEDTHWWFQSRLGLLERIMRRHAPRPADRKARMLDLGCGTGMFLEREGRGREAYGLDFSRQALSFTRRRGVTGLVCANSESPPYASDSFDVVTAFDLIEHVEHDDRLVAGVHRILRPGGVFIATVPAHEFLWSSHDVALHHMRRYRRRQFAALFDPQLWITRRSTYSFAMIFPPAAAIRITRKLLHLHGEATADTNLTPAWLNRILIAAHRVESAWIERFNSPIGLSILSVLEKR